MRDICQDDDDEEDMLDEVKDNIFRLLVCLITRTVKTIKRSIN